MHDIGKINIPETILNKQGKLTTSEFEEIKKHTIYGFGFLSNIKETSRDVKRVALLHHERLDRSGYPLNAEQDGICELTRIISVVDVYDAMISKRVYKEGVTPFEVLKCLKLLD